MGYSQEENEGHQTQQQRRADSKPMDTESPSQISSSEDNQVDSDSDIVSYHNIYKI